ncbi:preprotein translocase subunit SecY [Buchnera aphidicola (Cinara tujafilina)]|uniref:Protein translocase subunit SecY n=1 Tax=Buchnera aphidicola (Cinara tujafilina) TaxID=261317 RepID=F7WZN0_9GAMM|nr:preprotein translocase subunit SecY [Buchnera aphidicola]AEH39897.1 preprotein translocase subunit SecY [Buchnera aphidicola (Cinara tujafilina)]
MENINNLKNRIWFLIGAILIFRIGSFIPIPGINVDVLQQFLIQKHNSVLEIFNLFSGGSLSRASIFALGVMPYISASIIIELLTVTCNFLKELKKEGELGRNKINQYTKFITFFLACIQSFSVIIGLPYIPGMKNIIIASGFEFYFPAVISLVTGTIFLMWLGELITEKGLGNGISLIIFSGILSGLPKSIANTIKYIFLHRLSVFYCLLVTIIMVLIIYLVVVIEQSQRNIIVYYARQQQNRHTYSKNSSYLPLKLNMAGVVPVIFSSSIILFPSMIATYFYNICNEKNNFLVFYYLYVLIIFYILFFIFFDYIFLFFYTGLIFNVNDTSDNLKKSGAFLPGIRPGIQTSKYIKKIVLRLTLIGSIYTVFICLTPEIMRYFLCVPFYFGGTSLLIIVVVIIDFITQVQTFIMSTQYKSVLKKAHLYLKT